MAEAEAQAEMSENDERLLLVASTGGHLTQLIELADRLPGARSRTWVTFDSAQSRSSLAGEDVRYLPYVAPRGYLALAKCLRPASRILRETSPDRVVSTGAGIALAFLPAARRHGATALYIESATRAEGPSMTGKLLSRFRHVELATQHPGWVDDRWTYRGSVFDGFESVAGMPHELRRVVVTLGTMETYGFRRLVERLVRVLPAEAEVLWQTGVTDLTGLAVDGRAAVPASELEEAIATADLVIGHAGTGSALTALRLGKRPLLVPRRAAHGEHVDDHQLQTAAYLSGLGLATVVDASELDEDTLFAATAATVRRRSQPPPLRLDP